jgi:glycosyl transferase family 87
VIQRLRARTDLVPRMRDGSYLRAIASGCTVAGLAYIAMVWLGIAPYAPPVYDYGAYSYSPAFAQLIWPLTLLPWPVFAAAYTLGCIGCLFWMRVPWMIAFPGVIDDILRGNIHVFLAASIVLAIRGFPAAWTFGILAKVTPGVGILWHIVRAEWRNTAIALGVPFVIVTISFAVSSDLWFQWFDFLKTSVGASARISVLPLPFLVRLPIAAILIAFAGRTDRAWIVPIGVMIALPNVWTTSTALLAGSVSLWLADRRERLMAATATTTA